MSLFIALTLYAATSGVPWLFLLGLWLVTLVPAAFAYAAWNRHGVTLRLAVTESKPAAGSPAAELPDAVLRRSHSSVPVFEGDGMGLEISFRPRRGTRGPVWAHGEVGGATFTAGAAVVTRDGWSRVMWESSVRRGALRASAWRLGTSDPLGFFQGVDRMPEAEVALVLPRFTSLADRHQTREVEAAAAAPRAGSGNELFGIREYQPGDSLRRIHWRSSARRGELVVREYEPPGVQTLALLVDPRPANTDVADQVARIAASEAWDCLREGGRVAVGGALETRDIWDVLEWLARYPEGVFEELESPDVVVTANPRLLSPRARRNWLIGDAPVTGDVAFERVGTQWPI